MDLPDRPNASPFSPAYSRRLFCLGGPEQAAIKATSVSHRSALKKRQVRNSKGVGSRKDWDWSRKDWDWSRKDWNSSRKDWDWSRKDWDWSRKDWDWSRKDWDWSRKDWD